MKKIFIFFIVLYFSVIQNISADEYQPYTEGQLVENKLVLGEGKYNIPLPSGKFTVAITHEHRTSGGGTKMYSMLLLKLTKNNVLDEAVSVIFSRPTSNYWNPVETCKRTNFYWIKSYMKGNSQNCWIVNHRTFNFSGDKIKKNSFTGKMRDYLASKTIKTPNVGIYSNHFYSSPRHKNVYFEVAYVINPELRGIVSDKSRNWSESEYLLTRINNYPDKKKFMDRFVEISAQYQKDLETGIAMLPEHRLDTSMAKRISIDDALSLLGFDGQPMNKRGYDPKDPSYDPYNNKSQTMDNTNSKSNFINELNDLNKLYKSGALSKEEFEKAKKKILN